MGYSYILFLSYLWILIVKDVLSDKSDKYRRKRIVNGLPIASNNSQLLNIAVLEIYHLQGGDWMRHPNCFGTFIELDGRRYIATSARCFFPSRFTVEQYHTYSYSSRFNYRVFLGVVRINYGHNDFSRMNRLGIRSTITSNLVIIHPNLDLNNIRDDVNVAMVVIADGCLKHLQWALDNGHVGNLPLFQHIYVQYYYISPGDHCEIVGFMTGTTDNLEVLAGSGVRNVLGLSSADLMTLNSSHCSQMLGAAGINVILNENIFCLSGNYQSCGEVFLSLNEFGSGVFCGSDWFGTISNLFQWDIGGESGLQIQIATVTPRQPYMSFIRNAQTEQISGSCVTSSNVPSRNNRLGIKRIGASTAYQYNPTVAEDRISQ